MGGVVAATELGVDRTLLAVGKMSAVLVSSFWKSEEGDDRALIIGELPSTRTAEELGILSTTDETNSNILEVVVIGSPTGLAGGLGGVAANPATPRTADVSPAADDAVAGVCWPGITTGTAFVDANTDRYEVTKETTWDDDNTETALDDFAGTI